MPTTIGIAAASVLMLGLIVGIAMSARKHVKPHEEQSEDSE